jgi:hypothetical protein
LVGFLYFQDDNAISDLCVLNVSVGFRLVSNSLVTIWMNLASFWLVCFKIELNFVFINSWMFGGSVSFYGSLIDYLDMCIRSSVSSIKLQ